MQQEEVVERIKAFAQRVLPEGSSLWLYGSRARGDAHPDSDYDLLLLLNTERITDEDYEHYVYDLFLEGLDWGAEINTHAYPRHGQTSQTPTPSALAGWQSIHLFVRISARSFFTTIRLQNYEDYLNWQKKNTKSMYYCRGNLTAPRSIHCANCGNTENSWSISETT